MTTTADFKVGERVQADPGIDTWMYGDTYGEVVKIGWRRITVLLDRSGRRVKFHPDRLLKLEGRW